MSEPVPPIITLSVATAGGWARENVDVTLGPGFVEHLADVARDAARSSIADRLAIEREGVARYEAHLADQRADVAALERALAELDEKAPPPEAAHHHVFLRTLGWRCACGMSRAEVVVFQKESR